MEEKEIKIGSSSQTIKKGCSSLKEKRRKNHKKLSYIEPLEQPGTIYNAQVHGSAQRLLKVHRITKYVKFCKCCSLPQETPGVVVPFNFIDNQTDFGLGIYLYFYYIKICLVISFIIICLASVTTIIFSQQYSSDLNDYCELIFNKAKNLRNLDEDFVKDCSKFSTSNKTNETESSIYSNIIKVDWLISMSAHNIKNYHDIFKYEAEDRQKQKIEDVTIDYSLVYFITGITVLIVNYLFILHVNLLDECQNFEETTPRDYTVIIHGVPKPANNENMKKEVMNIITEVSFYESPLQLYQIIPCLRIAEIIQLAKEKFIEETKLYHINNFEKQKMLNKKNEIKYSDHNIYYFKELFCIKRKTPIQEIQNKINKLQNKLNNSMKDLNENPNKYNGGTFFVIFSTMQMRDKFYSFFPHNYGEKLFWLLRYFFECILFGCCVSGSRKSKIKLKLCVDVSQATEPYEVHWENMGHTRLEINCYKAISFFSTIALIIISLGIIVGLNVLQYKVSKDNLTGNTFVKYFLSLLISVVLAVSNIVGEIVLEKLSIMEKIEYKTSFYVSFSIKLTVYTFIVIAILPLVSNYINGDWGNNDLLVNNMLMIFITNIVIPPIMFYLSPGLLIKLYKRIKARLDLENIKYENSIYTQGELNEIFENPIMNIPYKYSYITNVFLVSLFYLSIFPIGMIFGFFGLLITYISEFFYVGMYKRPEILNSKLCKLYIYHFKWLIFIFSLGNYLFIGWLSKDKPVNWSLINLIVFFILCLIPYQSIKINTLGMSESESKNDTYEQNSIYFSTDYEKLCPFLRKEGFLRYFQKLLEEDIIDVEKSRKIIENLQNFDEIESYIKTMRHRDNFCSSMQLNNLYMKNKNLQKEKDIIRMEYDKDKSNPIDIDKKKDELYSSKDDPSFLEKVIRIKDYLYSFSTTTAGLSNALIFLGERDLYTQDNYNPWKVDWILSENYLQKRKNLINEILENIDYKGEISDDEDTIVNFGENDLRLSEEMKINNNININKEKNESIIINDNSNKPENNKNENIINEKIIKQKIRIDSNEEINSEKSESVQFIKNINNKINKVTMETDKSGSDNLFNNRPNIFNYSKINNSLDKTKIKCDKKENENNHSYFNNNNKNKLFDNSSLINEDEQKK